MSCSTASWILSKVTWSWPVTVHLAAEPRVGLVVQDLNQRSPVHRGVSTAVKQSTQSNQFIVTCSTLGEVKPDTWLNPVHLKRQGKRHLLNDEFQTSGWVSTANTMKRPCYIFPLIVTMTSPKLYQRNATTTPENSFCCGKTEATHSKKQKGYKNISYLANSKEQQCE